MSELDPFFAPRRVAVIGASSDPAKIGGRRFRTLIEGDFDGDVFAVNPRAEIVQGRPAYKSIDDVSGPVDLAIVAVRVEFVADAIAACAARRVPAVMIITAGFGETGAAGRAMEAQMVDMLAPHGGRLMGPNCAGLFDRTAGLNVTGMEVPQGPIGLVSQSGNVVLDIALHARAAGTGLSRYAAIGNGADVRPTDVVENLLDHDETRAVLAYIEGWNDGEGRRLHDLVRGHPSGKPVIVLKPGRSAAGRQAAFSHTGALAGDDRVVDAAFQSAGIWRASDPGDAVNVAAALARYPRLASDRVAILTDGGGHATLLADALGTAGFELTRFRPETRKLLEESLPERCAIDNPVDFAGVAEEDPAAVARTVAQLSAAPDVDAVALVGHFGGYHDNGGEEIGRQELAAAEAIVAADGGASLFVQSIHAHRAKPALERLRASGVSVLRSPAELAQVLAALRMPAPRGAPTPAPGLVRDAAGAALVEGGDESGRALLEPEARAFLDGCGFDMPPWRVGQSPEELAAECAAAGWGPVALKLIQPGLIHRSDVQGVLLNVAGAAGITAGAERLLRQAQGPGASAARVMATEMIASGVELAFGAFRDRHFGPLVMFGVGGVHLEAFRDVVFAPAPLSQEDAAAMLGRIRAAGLLAGARGGPAIDADAAARLLVRLGDVLAVYPEVDEIDLNPVILNRDGLGLADARVIVSGR